jgi:hypothetical protein
LIFAAENSNKFPKNQALEGKKSVEDMVTTLGPTALPHYYYYYYYYCKS